MVSKGAQAKRRPTPSWEHSVTIGLVLVVSILVIVAMGIVTTPVRRRWRGARGCGSDREHERNEEGGAAEAAGEGGEEGDSEPVSGAYEPYPNIPLCIAKIHERMTRLERRVMSWITASHRERIKIDLPPMLREPQKDRVIVVKPKTPKVSTPVVHIIEKKGSAGCKDEICAREQWLERERERDDAVRQAIHTIKNRVEHELNDIASQMNALRALVGEQTQASKMEMESVLAQAERWMEVTKLIRDDMLSGVDGIMKATRDRLVFTEEDVKRLGDRVHENKNMLVTKDERLSSLAADMDSRWVALNDKLSHSMAITPLETAASPSTPSMGAIETGPDEPPLPAAPVLPPSPTESIPIAQLPDPDDLENTIIVNTSSSVSTFLLTPSGVIVNRLQQAMYSRKSPRR
jgi:hypothetical protein